MSETFDLARLRSMRWEPRYHGRVQRSDSEIDMWLLVDDATGEGIVSLGVPPDRSDIADYVAACCGNPVRWVTALLADRNPNPIDEEAKTLADKFFAAIDSQVDPEFGQVNGYVLNRAMAWTWLAFCAQLPPDKRGLLLFEFLQTATTELSGKVPGEPS